MCNPNLSFILIHRLFCSFSENAWQLQSFVLTENIFRQKHYTLCRNCTLREWFILRSFFMPVIFKIGRKLTQDHSQIFRSLTAVAKKILGKKTDIEFANLCKTIGIINKYVLLVIVAKLFLSTKLAHFVVRKYCADNSTQT